MARTDARDEGLSRVFLEKFEETVMGAYPLSCHRFNVSSILLNTK